MEQKTMQFKWDGTDNTLLTCYTIIWAFIARFTATDFAALMAGLAGLSTVLLNWYKYWRIKNNKTKPDE